jgi:hypothetical protein
MSNTRANRISRRYYGQALSHVPCMIRRQVVKIAESTKGGIPHGLPPLSGWPESSSVFSYQETMLAEAIIDELNPKRVALIARAQSR